MRNGWNDGSGRERNGTRNPCPFFNCNNEHLYVEKVWGGQGWQVQCEECKARGPIMFTLAEAVNSWNKVTLMTIEARRSA